MLVSSCLPITPIKCLKGHKSLGSLCNIKIKSHGPTDSVTRSPIELFWTAKNIDREGQEIRRMSFEHLLLDE